MLYLIFSISISSVKSYPLYFCLDCYSLLLSASTYTLPIKFCPLYINFTYMPYFFPVFNALSFPSISMRFPLPTFLDFCVNIFLLWETLQVRRRRSHLVGDSGWWTAWRRPWRYGYRYCRKNETERERDRVNNWILPRKHPLRTLWLQYDEFTMQQVDQRWTIGFLIVFYILRISWNSTFQATYVCHNAASRTIR